LQGLGGLISVNGNTAERADLIGVPAKSNRTTAPSKRALAGREGGRTDARRGIPQLRFERRRPAPLAPERFTRPVWAAYGVLAVCLVAYIVSEIVRRDGQTWPWLDNWGVAAFEIVASLMCMARAFVTKRNRLIPLVLGLGLMAWSLGDLALAFESIGGATPPTPSVADGFYLCFYPITYVALMLLVRRQLRGLNMATWLDGAVAGLGSAAVCAAFVFQGVMRSAGGGTAAVATDLAYPIGDLLLLVMVAGLTTVLPGRRRAQWLLLAGGYAVQCVGDTFNLFGSGIGATHVGVAFNAVAWPVSVLLVSTSVWLRTRPAEAITYERAPGFVLPGVATLGALLILLVGSLQHIDLAALVLAAGTLAVAGVRVGLSLGRLRSLTEARHTQAVTDQLTTLGNRRALFELLDGLAAAEAAGDEPREMAFLFVDLNRFKEVNDSFGHSVGDELLRQLGERLKRSLRGDDLLVRLGGDEFAVALMDADADYGATVAQRITAELEEPFMLASVRARIGASIGIAVMPTDATVGKDLLRCADLAMYRAKLDGKAFAIYQEELDGHGNRMGMVEDLRDAIANRELELHYQPQVDLVTGEVHAVEALVRWNHPRLGSIPPLEFLPLAEDADLMDLLTEMVLDTALSQCAQWRAEGQTVAVSVNISTTNLLDPEFAVLVRNKLDEHRLEAAALVLEITETTAMADFDRCRQAIEDLRDLGLVVSVDDFGAGFTSLAYLSNLAVGELKLDRSFIHGLANSKEARNLALVRSTISLAHALGLRVVAEGVEDDASFELLAGLDCDLAQGYLISKPRPAIELGLERFETLAPTTTS
jgi:diguanylate cyclase